MRKRKNQRKQKRLYNSPKKSTMARTRKLLTVAQKRQNKTNSQNMVMGCSKMAKKVVLTWTVPPKRDVLC